MPLHASNCIALGEEEEAYERLLCPYRPVASIMLVFFVFFVYKSKFKKIMGLGRRGGEGGNFTGVIPDIALFCCSGGGGACRRRGGIESCRRRGDSSSGGSNTCNVRSRDGIYGGKEGGKEGSGEVGEGIYIY